ncbi:unnamed protein product, partial [Closterium sp. Naga37s-1]
DLSSNQLSGPIPKEIGSMVALTKLDLSDNQLSGNIPATFGALIQMKFLDLSNNQLEDVPSNLGALSVMTYMSLSYNKLSGPIPDTIGSLTSLANLGLRSNKLSGAIPPSIALLENINALDLSSNQLSGPIPKEIGSMVALTKLDLSDNQLSGNIPATFGSLIRMKFLDLSNNQLEDVPSTLGALSVMSHMSLSYNKLSGPIPDTIGSLTSLTNLGLQSNKLSGAIPPSIALLKNINALDLSSNQLSGPIPKEIGSMVALTKLDLSDNQLSGNIPAAFGALIKMEFLDLSNNQLEDVPSTLGALSVMTYLTLSYNNLSGLIPDTIGSLTSLTNLGLRSNKLSGSIPPSIALLQNINALDLSSNQLSGPIPKEIGSMVALTKLDISENHLSGNIPATFDGLNQMEFLDLSNNQLSGSIPARLSALSQVSYVMLANNQLTGPIPSDIGSLKRMVALSLEYNQLSGPIPASIGSLIGLTELGLHHNNLSGSIPPSISLLVNLDTLDLSSNQLSGPIPKEIGSMTALTKLDLTSNQFTGSIPVSSSALSKAPVMRMSTNKKFTPPIPAAGIDSLTGLVALSLGHNNISGPIPEFLTSLTSLTNLGLQSNTFSGSIPPSIALLSDMDTLDLSGNQLSGSIPGEIGDMSALTRLDLSGNKLSGNIPATLEGLNLLKSLYLHSNKLAGTVPSFLTYLTALTSLAIDNNRLTGPIPSNISSLSDLAVLSLSRNQLSGRIPDSITNLTSLSVIDFQRNLLEGTILETIGGLSQLVYLSLASNQLYGRIPGSFTKLTQLTFLDLSRNSLAGPIELPAISTMRLSNNFLSGPLPARACQARNFDANCFTLPPGCSLVVQREEGACNAFCGTSSAAPSSSAGARAAAGGARGAAASTTAACGGNGICVPNRASTIPSCTCDEGFIKLASDTCVAKGEIGSSTVAQPILPQATALTKGTQKEIKGAFTAAPVPLFLYEAGATATGCGTQLAFKANFTFSMSTGTFKGGNNGLAFVVSATDRVGTGAGVGYDGMDERSIAIEFDTFQDKQLGDMITQHVGLDTKGQETSVAAVKSPFPLNSKKAYTAWVDYVPGEPGTIQVFLAASVVKPEQPLLKRSLALCEVLQAGADQRAFFFGFVATTTEKPFQMHVILKSAVQTALPDLQKPGVTPALGLTLSATSFAPPGASPFMRYMSADYQVSPNQPNGWRISASRSWDSMPFLAWPVKNQKDCNASWAYAVVASVEAAYGIALNQKVPRLTVDSLFTIMGLKTPAAKCSTGNSPAAAFKKLIALPRGGLASSTTILKYPVQSFERAQFKGYVGLMLAVKRQPVVVQIEASVSSFAQYDGTFKYQDPACYTGNLNHAVLVVGYLISTTGAQQSSTAPPFWIIRNSWGTAWGDKGHMRMDIQGGDGVCGINVLPGLYPIVKIANDSCGQMSYKGDGDLQPSMNPCGRFPCQPYAKANSNTCNCTIPGEASQPFIEVANGVGSNTCAYVNICSSYPTNPCGAGTCINDGKGSYSCICPPNYISSTTVEKFPTCDPANTTASTLTVTGTNWQCSDVFPTAGVSLAGLSQQNTAIDCSEPLPPGKVIQLGSNPTGPCTAFFSTINGDNCSSIATQIKLAATELAALNPGLNCSEPIKPGHSLCIERNATLAYTIPQCWQYGMLTAQDTCEGLMLQSMQSGEGGSTGAGVVTADSWVELYRNNPGVICPRTTPPSTATVASKTSVQVRLGKPDRPEGIGYV